MRELLQKLPANARRAGLIAQARTLQGLIEARAPGEEIAKLAQALRWGVIGAYGLAVAPKQPPDLKRGQVFNRIHVEDLASVLISSMHAPGGSPIHNVVDDELAPADEVLVHAARLLGVEPSPAVPIEEAQLPPFAAHFYAECRRVRNDLIKIELDVTLRYPPCREGLRRSTSAFVGTSGRRN